MIWCEVCGSKNPEPEPWLTLKFDSLLRFGSEEKRDAAELFPSEVDPQSLRLASLRLAFSSESASESWTFLTPPEASISVNNSHTGLLVVQD